MSIVLFGKVQHFPNDSCHISPAVYITHQESPTQKANGLEFSRCRRNFELTGLGANGLLRVFSLGHFLLVEFAEYGVNGVNHCDVATGSCQNGIERPPVMEPVALRPKTTWLAECSQT